MITDYHAKYYAHALTRRSSSDSLEKLGTSLLNATVDLNPHQIEAALFAFRSPLSRGAILADEVGLGKTIEAGLIISQLWAERRRKILVVVPTTLRKQWAQELADKFFLPSEIFDSGVFNARKKAGSASPLADTTGIAICSYNFARA
jgi:SNF2 family DNA or RNA helicase